MRAPVAVTSRGLKRVTAAKVGRAFRTGALSGGAAREGLHGAVSRGDRTPCTLEAAALGAGGPSFELGHAPGGTRAGMRGCSGAQAPPHSSVPLS